MKGYSKIKLMNSSTKSRSMDFSDETIITPRIQKPISIKKSTITAITQEQARKPDDNDDDDDDDEYKQYSGNHEQEDHGNLPTKMLTRNHSGKSTSSRFKIEKQYSTGTTLQIAAKRAFSIRRSSSVSERYCRIHDQYANPIGHHHHEEEEEEEEGEEEELRMARSQNKLKKQRSHGRGGGVLKACKRIFGLI